MAESSFNCNVSQGFNFQKDDQSTVGHIVSVKIGDTALASDINVTNPEDNTATVAVFGVASSVYWAGGYADPIFFECRVSNANKNTLGQLVHKSLANTAVELKFNVYDYDPIAKKYYKAFHTNDAVVTGLIYKQGGSLAMNLSMDQAMEVTSPKNFAFQLGTMPSETDMAIQLAISVTDKFAKKWGVKVGA